jgi:hypothetical protein
VQKDRELPSGYRVSFPDQAQAVLAALLLPARDRTREAETIVEAWDRDEPDQAGALRVALVEFRTGTTN